MTAFVWLVILICMHILKNKDAGNVLPEKVQAIFKERDVAFCIKGDHFKLYHNFMWTTVK